MVTFEDRLFKWYYSKTGTCNYIYRVEENFISAIQANNTKVQKVKVYTGGYKIDNSEIIDLYDKIYLLEITKRRIIKIVFDETFDIDMSV